MGALEVDGRNCTSPLIAANARVALSGAITVDAGIEVVAQPDALTMACGHGVGCVSGDSCPVSWPE